MDRSKNLTNIYGESVGRLRKVKGSIFMKKPENAPKVETRGTSIRQFDEGQNIQYSI